MNASLNLHNIDKLLDGYGITIRHATSCSISGLVPRERAFTQGGLAAALVPQILNVARRHTLHGQRDLCSITAVRGLFRLPQVAPSTMASSITMQLQDKQPDADPCKDRRAHHARSIKKTDENAILKPFQAWKPKGRQWAQYGVAADVEGRLKTRVPERRRSRREIEKAGGREQEGAHSP